MIFSVIIPVYNVGEYIQKCIESVIKQVGISYEIILVDDGSKDQSVDICDQYADQYDFVSVIHKENGGLSDARNVGVMAAKGEYILFVDGDDYINEGSFQYIADVIKKRGNPDVICLELVKFFENSEETVSMKDGIDEKINGLKDDELYNYFSELPKYPASACTKAIRRQMFIDNDLFFINGLLSEDLEWCIRLLLAAKSFGYCGYQYYFYRQARRDSISNTPSEKKAMDILGTFQKWTENSKTMYKFEKKMVCSYMEYVFRFLLLRYEDVSVEKRKEYKKRLKEGSWVLGTRKDKVSMCIRVIYKVFGIKITGILLKKYLSVRGY